jgi:hypothetical protein
MKGYATQGTVLYWGPIIPVYPIWIKDFPDMGGPLEGYEATDLSDISQIFVPGLTTLGSMEFTANYSRKAFNDIAGGEDREQHYDLRLPDSSVLTWTGHHKVFVVGAGARALIEMKIVVIPSSAPELL